MDEAQAEDETEAMDDLTKLRMMEELDAQINSLMTKGENVIKQGKDMIKATICTVCRNRKSWILDFLIFLREPLFLDKNFWEKYCYCFRRPIYLEFTLEKAVSVVCTLKFNFNWPVFTNFVFIIVFDTSCGWKFEVRLTSAIGDLHIQKSFHF